MTTIFKSLFSVAVLCLFINAGSLVTNTYALEKDYTVTIKGTSNLHDWSENVNTVTGNGVVTWNSDGTFDLTSIAMKMNVRSIKSKEGAIMNNNTYKALKADDHPEILFSLTAPIKAVVTKYNDKAISAKGNLTIAGVTKAIDIQVKVFIYEKTKLGFEGSKTIKMSDFGIKPPTALLGTLKTGDAITIEFKTNFALKN
ncbi:hypothetical protein CNR22_02060 [Sphingobacteriaceae bacterium]|nr:hypothetical protein CNR22_02060 [Sphingobacteriaceae bacterium]